MFCLHVCLHHVRAWCPWRSENVMTSGTGLAEAVSHHVGCWEMSSVLCKSSFLSSSVVVFKYMISPVIFLSYPPFLTSCFCWDKSCTTLLSDESVIVCVLSSFFLSKGILSAQYMKELCILRQQCVYPLSAMSWVTTSASPAVAAQLWSTTVLYGRETGFVKS